MFLRRLLTAALGTAVAVVGTVTVAASPAAAAPALPSGFVLTDMTSGQGPFNLTDFAYLPEGGLLSIGKNGKVTRVSTTGQATTIATIPVMTDNDLGLIAIALDRDYATNRRIYLVSNHPGGGTLALNRLSRWTVTVDGNGSPTGLTGQKVIFEYTQTSYIHALWGLVTAPDGTLWLSTGDGGWHTFVDPVALQSMDLNLPAGKLLHINPDGSGVAGNPYYSAANPNSWRSRIYASGLRSPFRLSLDPTSGTPILGDVGWNTHEEINVVRPGSFQGWPCWEANQPTPGYKDFPQCAGMGNSAPVFAYPRSFGGSSVTGGVVYTGEAYPEKYRGAYFFGDFAGSRIWTMKIGADGGLERAPEAGGFATDIGGPVKFDHAPNGDIVYADIYSGKIRRLSYAPGNRLPTAKATATNNPSTLTVTFDASDSFDPDGDALSYRWDFGDGSPAGSGVTVSHKYAGDGNVARTVTLTVTDALGGRATDTLTVVPANHAPALFTQFPEAGRTFTVGDEVTLTANASDDEDGPLQVEWTTDLLHCRSIGCHSHPGPAGAGSTFSKVFTDHGEDTRLHITARATDSRGVVTERTFIAEPRLRKLLLTSTVPAVIQLGDQATFAADVTVGATVTITAAATSTDGGAAFHAWTDGATRQRQYVMPDQDVTLTATYLTAIDRRYATDAAFRTILGPPTTTEVAIDKARMRIYQNGRAYWSPTTPVCEVHGAIVIRYVDLGGHVKFGVPITDERGTGNAAVRYSDFAGTPATSAASIYWTLGTGANEIYGAIRGKWVLLGKDAGVLGHPITGERPTPDGIGRFNHFSKGGSIYWTPGTGSHEVHGAIRQRWQALGWERGPLGYPTTDESKTPDGVGRYNHFTKGASVYWTPGTGAKEVYGAIRGRWAQLGWERSYLGYPTSGEYSIPGGRRSDFQRGYITWDARTGQVTDRRR